MTRFEPFLMPRCQHFNGRVLGSSVREETAKRDRERRGFTIGSELGRLEEKWHPVNRSPFSHSNTTSINSRPIERPTGKTAGGRAAGERTGGRHQGLGK